MQAKLLIARFPFGGSENPACTNWLVQTVLKAKADPRISSVHHIDVDDTPITMSRNRVLRAACSIGADLVLMVDSDMRPDLPLAGARPFWDTALKLWFDYGQPCLIGAPYCGPPPNENVYVFQWARRESHSPNPDLRLAPFGREEAAQRGGVEQVAALPTGLILIDMRVLKRLKPPFFYYEWEDGWQDKKASTEDVAFTRDVSLSGNKIFVLWDCWAGHYKRKCVGKPVVLTVNDVRQQFREAVLRDHHADEKLVMVGEGGVEAPLQGYVNPANLGGPRVGWQNGPPLVASTQVPPVDPYSGEAI